MKTLKNLLLFVPLALLLTGCPYNAEIALDEKPAVKVDERLIGSWEQKSSSSDYVYTVTKKDDFTYVFVKENTKSGDKQTYNAFTTDIDGTKFLSLWQINEYDSKPSYYFYKLVIEKDYLIKMVSVTENIDEKFETSAQMRDYFKKNMHLSFFYDKTEEEYIKK